MSQLKQNGKYHVKYLMTVNEFVAQILFEQDNVCVDTDHAGCALTRRSTTGLATMLAKHVCTTCKQHPVRDCVVQRRIRSGTDWYEAAPQHLGCRACCVLVILWQRRM